MSDTATTLAAEPVQVSVNPRDLGLPSVISLHESGHYVIANLFRPDTSIAAVLEPGQDDAGNQWLGTCS